MRTPTCSTIDYRVTNEECRKNRSISVRESICKFPTKRIRQRGAALDRQKAYVFVPFVRLQRLVRSVSSTRLEEFVHFGESRRSLRILRRLHDGGDVVVFSVLVAKGGITAVAVVGPQSCSVRQKSSRESFWKD